jgi:hypothetical protein
MMSEKSGIIADKGWASYGRPLCTETLSAGAVMVKPAKEGMSFDCFDAADSLNVASDRCILVQGSVRSDAIIIVGLGFSGLDANASHPRQ